MNFDETATFLFGFNVSIHFECLQYYNNHRLAHNAQQTPNRIYLLIDPYFGDTQKQHKSAKKKAKLCSSQKPSN